MKRSEKAIAIAGTFALLLSACDLIKLPILSKFDDPNDKFDSSDKVPPASLPAVWGYRAGTEATVSWTAPADADFAGVKAVVPGIREPFYFPAAANSGRIAGLAAGKDYDISLSSIDYSGNISDQRTLFSAGTQGALAVTLTDDGSGEWGLEGYVYVDVSDCSSDIASYSMALRYTDATGGPGNFEGAHLLTLLDTSTGDMVAVHDLDGVPGADTWQSSVAGAWQVFDWKPAEPFHAVRLLGIKLLGPPGQNRSIDHGVFYIDQISVTFVDGTMRVYPFAADDILPEIRIISHAYADRITNAYPGTINSAAVVHDQNFGYTFASPAISRNLPAGPAGSGCMEIKLSLGSDTDNPGFALLRRMDQPYPSVKRVTAKVFVPFDAQDRFRWMDGGHAYIFQFNDPSQPDDWKGGAWSSLRTGSWYALETAPATAVASVMETGLSLGISGEKRFIPANHTMYVDDFTIEYADGSKKKYGFDTAADVADFGTFSGSGIARTLSFKSDMNAPAP